MAKHAEGWFRQLMPEAVHWYEFNLVKYERMMKLSYTFTTWQASLGVDPYVFIAQPAVEQLSAHWMGQGAWWPLLGPLSWHVVTSGLILGLHPANERLRYFVTTSFIGWVQA